jgi:hypothetical protein
MSYTLIERRELASNSSSIEFTSVPQFYSDLIILASVRDDRNVIANGFNLIVNGSTANSSGRNLYGSGSSTASLSLSSEQLVNSGTATASTFGNMSIYIPNYSVNGVNKSFSIDAVSETNGTEAYQSIFAGLWAGTAPITSIGISMDSQFGGSNFVAGSSISLYGINRQQAIGRSPQALGGIIAQANGYWYHTFTGSGTFRPFNNIEAEYLVIAGGGGGASQAGGGGAGGYRSSVVGEFSGANSSAEARLSLTGNTNYAVTVGAGGAGGGAGANAGVKGNNSVFGSITSEGGGLGGLNQAVAPGSGGSGGGGGFTVAGAAGASGQGRNGGNGGSESGQYVSGGGGGASGLGMSAPNENTPGAGGAGLISAITGLPVARAGGGGGSGFDSTGTDNKPGGAGGFGGGGIGGGNGLAAGNGAPSTGGGGGGGGSPNFTTAGSRAGGAGGSGVVIIRYKA